MSSFEYFGTLGVHRVRWLGPSLVRFAATNCQAGEILNEKVSQWVLSCFCLIVCVIVGIFPRFVISLLPFSTRQDTLQELHRKLQSLEERLEEELLKTGKALRKDFREDTERWGDDYVSSKGLIQTLTPGICQTLSPLKLQVVRLLRKDWEGWHGLQNKAFIGFRYHFHPQQKCP